MPVIIAIDGPAGSGKSTVARRLALHLELPYIDTGSMYRAVGRRAVENSVALDQEDKLTEIASSMDFRFEFEAGVFKVLVSENKSNFEELGPEIRTPEISMAASHVAQVAGLRKILVKKQQEAGRVSGGVLEGRDAGTVIFPEADYKFFVHASPEVRAQRRHEELVARMADKAPTYEKVLSDVRLRDNQDSSRKASPLKPAEDAVTIDTSDMDSDEVFRSILRQIEVRRGS